jgi:hypothetical protein
MFNILSHEWNENGNITKIPFQLRMAIMKITNNKCPNAGMDARRRESSYTVDGNVN